MNVLCFTAEASLYETSRHYRTSKRPITSPTRMVNRIYPAMKDGVTYIPSQRPALLPMLAGGSLGGAGVGGILSPACQLIDRICDQPQCFPGSNVCWQFCTDVTVCT